MVLFGTLIKAIIVIRKNNQNYPYCSCKGTQLLETYPILIMVDIYDTGFMAQEL